MATNHAPQTAAPTNALASISESESAGADDAIVTRSLANVEAMNATGGGKRPGVRAVDLLKWVNSDAHDFHLLPDEFVTKRLDTLADNFALQPYADAMRIHDPGLANRVSSHTDVRMATNFIAANADATKAEISHRLARIPASLAALFTDPARLAKIEMQVAKALHWLPSEQLNEIHSTIASVLNREDAPERARRARESQAETEVGLIASAAEDPALREHRIQEVAGFIAANRGLLSWKVRDNITNADPELRAFLSDAHKMKAIEAAVMERLGGISPLFVAEIQAIIAGALNRPDADARAQEVLRLRVPTEPAPADQAQMESPEPPPNPPIAAGSSPAPEPPVADSPNDNKQTTQQEARPQLPSGIRPGNTGVKKYTPEPIGDLLEHITYQAQRDGSVLYLLKDKAAFVDHGDHLLMSASADRNERAILAALLLAKEKYAGNFELTGEPSFQRRAIEILLKYQIDVQLKNPAQELLLQQLSQERQDLEFPPASPAQPVKPFPMAVPALSEAPDTQDKPKPPAAVPVSYEASEGGPTPAESPIAPAIPPIAQMEGSERRTRLRSPGDDATGHAQPPPANPTEDDPSTQEAANMRLHEGKVIKHGRARFNNKKYNDMSYFVELEDASGARETVWGVDLQRAARVTNLQVGDQVVLKDEGKKAVEVQRVIVDENEEPVETRWVQSRRVHWAISKLPMANAKAPSLQPPPLQLARHKMNLAKDVQRIEEKVPGRQNADASTPRRRQRAAHP